MSEQAKQAIENTELIRDLVDPLKSQVESEDGDRSPAKIDRDLKISPTKIDEDLKAEVLAKTNVPTPSETETVRKLVVPEPLSKSKDDDRSFS